MQSNALKPRILGGENAVVRPFQFFLASSTPTRHDFGSATLISDRHAITAGKLVAGYQKWIMAYGSTKLGAQSKKLESRIAFLHPAYDAMTHENDLGIILLPALPPNCKYLNLSVTWHIVNLELFTLLIASRCSQLETDCIATGQRRNATIQ